MEGLQWHQLRPVPHPTPARNPLSSPGSVSHWIAALKGGDPAAAQPLRERYYRRLVALARKKLQSTRRAADEEDVVQNAFHSFFRAVAQDAERGRRRGKGGAERGRISESAERGRISDNTNMYIRII